MTLYINHFTPDGVHDPRPAEIVPIQVELEPPHRTLKEDLAWHKARLEEYKAEKDSEAGR